MASMFPTCGLLAIVWYLGLFISVLFGLTGYGVFGTGAWVLLSDLEIIRNYVPTLVLSNEPTLKMVITAVVSVAVLVAVSSSTFAVSLFTRSVPAQFFTTMFFCAFLGFSSIQVWASGIFSLTKPGMGLLERTLLLESKPGYFNISNDDFLLSRANKLYGCCGIYDLKGGCDQDYPGVNCGKGSSECSTGCLNEIDQKMFYPYQLGITITLWVFAFMSTVSFFWRLWSHKDARKFIQIAIPLCLVVFGLFVSLLGAASMGSDFPVLRLYLPSFVKANLDKLTLLAILLILSGFLRIPYTIMFFFERSAKARMTKMILRLFASFFIIAQLVVGWGATIYFLLDFQKPAFEKALQVEAEDNFQNGLLIYANRKYQCCGITNLPGGCDVTYPGVGCSKGSSACEKGCLDDVWAKMSLYYVTCVGFLAFNSIVVSAMAIFLTYYWCCKRKLPA